MSYRSFMVATALAAMLSGCQTSGSSFTETAVSGAPRKIVHVYSIGQDCNARGIPRVSAAESPRHGRLVFREGDNFPSAAPGSPLAVCNSTQVPGVTVTYIPERGYSGSDSFVLRAVFPNGRENNRRYDLHVK